MTIEVMTLADFAQVVQNKLTVVGTFNNIAGGTLPINHSFALACRFLFAPKEIPFKEITINLIYKDGDKEEIIVPNIIGNINSQSSESHSQYDSLNFVVNFNNINFSYEGWYFVRIKGEGFSRELPIHIILKK